MFPNETNLTIGETEPPGADIGFGFVIVIPGVLANIIAIIFFTKASRKTGLAVHSLLLTLAVTDLTGCVLAGYTATTAYTGKIQNVIACNILSFVTSLCPMATAVVACLLAVDRYLALCHPFKYKTKVTQRKAVIAVCGSLALSTVISMLPFIGLGNYYRELVGIDGEIEAVCSVIRFQTIPHERIYGIVYGNVCLCIIIIVITANFLTIKTVLSMRRSIESSSQGDGRMCAELKFVKMVIGVSLLLLICWSPFMAMFLMIHVGIDFPLKNLSRIMILASLNFIIDPFVHIFLRQSYRQAIWRMCCCRCSTLDTSSSATAVTEVSY